MAEVDLASARIGQMMDEIRAALKSEASMFMESDTSLVSGWSEMNPLVETAFTLRDGRIETSFESVGAKKLRTTFGSFLERGERMPTYDLVTRIYRYEAHDEPEIGKKQKIENETIMSDSDYMEPSPPSVPASGYSVDVTPGKSPGITKQQMQSRMASDPEAREDLFEQASREGFEILKRNVAVQTPIIGSDTESASKALRSSETRSGTVSRRSSFKDLTSVDDDGLLPNLSDDGLQLLFWAKSAPGTFVGCTLRMDIVRDRIAGIMPDILSDVRILTVLDDSGAPLVVPEAFPYSEPDWRLPFAAREISPALPRWEVGAWLINPEMLISRANFARFVVWAEVAVLSLAIVIGSVVILRMMSYEMRVAGQKTTFVANVSHELKTPLTSIRLFAELLLSGRQGNEERRQSYLRTIISETDRLSHLVGNVLTFSRRGRKYHMQELSLTEVTRDTLAQLEPHLSKMGFRVTILEDGPLPVKGNREALRQVIMNILSNAEKYSGDAREISVTCRSNDGMASVTIEDRGIGVDPGLSEKIFQEFYRADDSLSATRSGAGLGLPIARNIARAHGGDVRYSPRPGGGSSFTLTLPA
ncbi:MAG: HAMP domain-containing histidine kinase [Synergistaceae bacterium]|nr:HAMP domain-containing histidine kinase [Synergistaceae bacterium]